MIPSLAIIDLGTNTFNLLIQRGNTTVVNTKIPVKLGEGGITRGIISAEAFQRGQEALLEYAQIIRREGVPVTYAFATSALREASNGRSFCDQAQTATGIVINVISGEQEAQFIADGVRLAHALPDGPALIMDIGGGSTEFILCNGDQNLWLKSHPLGVSRLFQLFSPNDPLSTTDRERANQYIDQSLTDLWQAINQWKPNTLVGSSGSFDTLTDMVDLRLGVPPKTTTARSLDLPAFHQLCNDLLGAALNERLAMPGMVPMRADTIGYSCLLIQQVIQKGRFHAATTSAYSLKEGVLHTLEKPNHPWQKSLL
jgi:exopolyphosphatase/guanosine-5'-triphosphate,3'-diphosphate pyrophosphatase